MLCASYSYGDSKLSISAQAINLHLCTGHLQGNWRQAHRHGWWLSPQYKVESHILHLTTQCAPKLLLDCLSFGQLNPSFHSHSPGLTRWTWHLDWLLAMGLFAPGPSRISSGVCIYLQALLATVCWRTPLVHSKLLFSRWKLEILMRHGSWQLLPQEQWGPSLTELYKPH